jgi:sugar transferase (PEP-CTERM/EpsH1 system associated)
MRILFLSPRQCWPPVSGAKLREYFLARALGGISELTHVSFTPDDADPQTVEALPFCRRVITVPLGRRYTAGKILRGIVGPDPLPVLNYTSAAMFAAVESVLRKERFDLVHLDGLQLFGYDGFLRKAAGTPILYDWHNIESEAMGRYAAGQKAPRAWYAALTARRLESVENRILGTAYGNVVCSERERERLSRSAPRARVAVVENGVDAAHFDPAGAPPPAGPLRRLVFVGQMSYHANADAAVAFVRHTWPRIVERHPEWTLSLVGASPGPEILALRNCANVEVTGTVPDVRPYYRDALAAIVPLLVGGGTRLKILEAMAAGVPVVSTAVGAEGLAVAPGRNIVMAETADQWLAALEALSGNVYFRSRISAAGRALVSERYDWRIIGDHLATAYRGWMDGQ